jgi:hypothetical protein
VDGVSSNISVVKKKAGAARQLESFRGQTGILIVRSLALQSYRMYAPMTRNANSAKVLEPSPSLAQQADKWILGNP